MTEETLFAAALGKGTPAERAAFLDEACASDAALRRRIEALLESHGDTQFLRTPAVEHAARALGRGATATTTEPTTGADPDPPLDFVAPPETPSSLGRLGHYEVLEVIGRGGMGVVLRAFDEKLHRIVAIKVMAAQLATSVNARRRFAREAQAAAAVSHDHIVTIHAVEEAGELPYLVMQYVAGMSLQERLENRGPLQLHEILRIGMQTASGLASAHAQGLIHRDIKPANILLENGVERVRITDFGLARAVDDASLTQSGVVAGTPQYMAPEQARGEPVDPRADLFSLGSVLYAMCTGRAPFRASGTMAVLKRVCEETPSPVREANPEVPDWLVAIIEKLHAKDPAGRYQSAAEVAEILGRHLAHVQHPAVVPPPPIGKPSHPSPPSHHGRWPAVVAGLLCLAAGLGYSEATGVTQLTATVIRILTPDGTLVVETSDPAVKVTIEGDGGLVIAQAGAQEVRLRPGSYRVHAAKDGKPLHLDRDLVMITRSDKQIVRVRLEGADGQSATTIEHGSFVLLGADGTPHRRFDGLADAVLQASEADTVEICGNGPYVIDPIAIEGNALTIRAGHGYRPVIRLSQRGVRAYEPIIRATAPLVLEGIEFQRLVSEQSKGGEPWPGLIVSQGSPLHVANCLFRSNCMPPGRVDLITADSPVCCVRNCALICPAEVSVGVNFPPCRSLTIENCVHLGRFVLSCGFNAEARGQSAGIRLMRNTIVSSGFPAVYTEGGAELFRTLGEDPRVRLKATGNIFGGGSVLQFGQGAMRMEPHESDRFLRGVLTWRDRNNLIHARGGLLYRSAGNSPLPPSGPRTAAEWKAFWGEPDASVLEGVVRYEGGNLASRLLTAPDSIAPADFRLRPDSPGYRAGPDGEDLGADVDLVGPGPAYERWRKTTEYQAWLEETRIRK